VTSEPLTRWLGPRREAIDNVATGHAKVGDLTGPGRPLDASKPLVHAYVLVIVSQFQGFVRDMHDLAVERLLSGSGATVNFLPILTEGIVNARNIDRGNPTHSNIIGDFASLGLSPFDMASRNGRWATPGDAQQFNRLMALRNALAHGNDDGLRNLLVGGGVQDTVSWSRAQLPVLNRYARPLDHMVWDHLKATTGKVPWR
jgi:hypothetical protein